MNGKILLLFTFIVFSGCLQLNEPQSDDLNGTDLNSVGFVDCDDSADNSCLVGSPDFNNTDTEASIDDSVRIEVFHFHSTRQCYSCIRLGELSEKTLNEFFREELDSNKIVFGHLNVDLEENKELTAKYGASGASLWIGTYINGVFHKEQNIQVWYKIDKEEEFKSYLKEILERRLKGELN